MTRTVGDLMATNVLAARDDAGYRELAAFMRAHHVSALPVVDGEHHVLGVVSTADLLLKLADPDPEEGYMAEPFRERLDRIKSTGTTAHDLMTSPAVTVTAGTAPREAAEVMRRRGVRRLPVVDGDGRLVGLVGRSDLLRVYEVSDDALTRTVEDVVRGLLGLTDVVTTADHGVVTLSGGVVRRSDIPRLVHAVRAVEGVVHVRCHLAYGLDDLTLTGTTA
ncbi:CBS domain-containing protein [Nocardiopsis halotolerans]|uniref:CBS domain-containing protein n=1 Tax=Nocardiopsis halotolerans TaxID=124252 RepID=UPI00034844B1|nr:CBS domain-containing protein [Nocardiopsis halotolerans]